MSKKIKILSPIVIILLFVIIFMFYQKSNNDDKYDTSDLLAKQETLNQDETTELASKTLILCANNFDTNKTKAIKTEKIGENVYYLTYDSSKKADHALDKYSKDENIIYCEKDTAIQTSEVDDTPSIQEAIINQHKNSETGDIYNNIDVNEDENKIDRNKATIVVIDSGANGTYKNAYNAFNGSSDVTDTVGHGTKMIETIKENISEENYEIVPIKIANDNGYATVSSLIKALNYAVKLNPTIVNISLTSTNKGSAEILNQYITKLGDNGTAVVVSAGNNHDNVANYVPANSSNAITVGSCDTTGKIKTFSNYGEGINWLVTSDSTSEAAAITSGLYASAFLKNESPLKILKESGKVFDYKQDTLENLDNLTIDDEAVWWCGGTYSDSGALGGVGTVYTTHRSITTWNVVYDDKKHGSETWPSGVTISIINHKKDHHPYYIHNGHTYVALSNDGPRNTNGNNPYIRSYGWFEISEVTNAVSYTVNVDHWMWGFTNKEGNNNDNGKTAYKIGNTNWQQPPNSKFEMGRNRHYLMPKGFDYNPNGIWCGTTSKTYAYGTNFTADKDYYFQYSIYPINYTITYDLDGGTQDTHNPNSYNVIYEKYLYNPGKAGYTFTGWTQTNNILGNGTYNYTFKNTLSGNKFSFSKVQLFGINQSDKTWKYISTIVATSTTGKVSETYTHNEPSGVYSIRVGANGNKEDKVADIYNIYFEKGAQYKIEYDTTYSEQKITMSNVSIKRVTAVTALNKGKNGTALATSNYYAESCTRQIGNVTLKANWKANKYTVSYNANGGTGTMSTDTILYGQDYTAKENAFTRNGYTFIGWNENADGTGVDWTTWIGKPWMWQYTKNITLYAQWKKNDTKYTNTLNYDANGGTGAPASQTASVTYPNTASTFTVSTTKPSRTGYTFTGWYTAATGGTKVETTYTVGKDNQAKNQSATIYAHWTANTYKNTLYYNTNGGNDAPITVSEAVTVTFPDTQSIFEISEEKPVKKGYTFDGWYTDLTGGTKVDSTITVGSNNYAGNQSRTIYAHWKANTYTNTLRYDANGGTGAPDSQTASVTYPNTASKFTVSNVKPSRTGYTFTGWYTAANGGTKVGTEYTVGNNNQAKNQSATLYAQWTANKYTNTLKYDANGGTGAPATQTASVTYPNTASKFTVSTTKPSRTGYTFTGWYTAANGGTKVGTEYTVGSNNQAKNQSATLYAHWKANVYTVTLQPSGGSLNVEDGSITKNSNGSATFEVTYDTTNYYNLGITASKTGYQVNGFYNNTSGGKKLWNNGGACLNDGTYWLNNKWHYAGDVTLYVQWTANTYTIKYDGNGATGGSTASSNHTYDSAKTLTPNGFVKTGYTFNGWNTQSNGKGTSYPDKAYVKNLTAVNNSTVTLYAQWKANTYTVTYNSNKPTNASTTISGTMQTDTATYDQNYTTRANGYTLPGYTFVGWNEKADGTGTDWTGYINKPLRWTYTRNITLYAQWKANKYTVTYDSNKPVNASTTMSGTMSTDTATFDQNYITRENGFKLPGYTFVGWNEKKDGTGTDWTGYINKPWRWTYTKNVTLYAQWKANTYTIKLDGNGNTSGTMSNINATFDKEIKLPNSTFRKTEYHFIGWSTTKNGNVEYKDGATIKNLTSEQGKTVTLYAVWKELPKAKGVDIAIIKDDGVKMINNNTLESFVHTELQLTIANNEDNITLQSYKILNLDEIKSKINNTESQSEIEIKVEVTYSTGDKSYKVINKDGNPCKLRVLTLVLGDSEQTYTRYIEDDGTLKANSSWTTTTKKTLLEEALNKNLDEIPSKDITK